MLKSKSHQTSYMCNKCRRKKLLRCFFNNSQFCVWCMKKTNTDIVLCAQENISTKESLKMRHKGRGFKRFISEFLDGWFPSVSSKLKSGVYKTRIIDKENDRYYEVVKDAKKDKKIHECDEPLSQHRK